MHNDEVFVIGGGGHGKIVVRLLHALGLAVAGVLDDDPRRWGHMLLDIPITGPVTRSGIGSARAVIAIGDGATRKSISGKLDCDWLTLVHPRAFVDPSVRLGKGTVVLVGAVIQLDSVIGNHAIVNTGATVDHDCFLGDFVSLAPGVHLAGGVRIEEGSMLGVGAVAAPGTKVGAWSTIAAAAAVVHDLPAQVLAMGVPAKVVRQKSVDSGAPQEGA